MSNWRYKLSEPFKKYHPLLENIVFHNEWVDIKYGTITISKDYAWDGCSPAYKIPVYGWISPPEGPINGDGRPQSYFATLIHDALCQYREEICITKESTVSIFQYMLLQGGFPVWRAVLYAKAVEWFGPQLWRGYAPLVPDTLIAE